MSFVDEHYNSILRALARSASIDLSEKRGSPSTASTSSSSVSSTEGRPESSDTGSSSKGGPEMYQTQLAARSFDISTQLLSNTDRSRQNDLRLENVLDDQLTPPPSVHPSVHTGRNFTVRPSLSNTIRDLELVRGATQCNIQTNSSARADLELVLFNAVASIHAHTIDQLLTSTTPLSLDIEYWSAQDSNTASIAMYFIQSLPFRVYAWGKKVISIISRYSECEGNELKDQALYQLRASLSPRLLFPEICVDTSSSSRRRKQNTVRALFSGIPRGVDLLSLTRREIRHKIHTLSGFQDSLALSIGILSQAVISYDLTQKPNVMAAQLLAQVSSIVDDAYGTTDSIRVEGISDTSEIAVVAVGLANKVNTISAQFLRKSQIYRRPHFLKRAWLPALLGIYAVRYASSYISGHKEDFKEWLSDSAETVGNYLTQYILEPMRSAYETIRYGKRTYTIATEESLVSDIRSLENMVVSFAQRTGVDDIAHVRQRVVNGDLSDVMDVYAREMQSPFRNLMFGDLVQAMLIQVQKVKVDVGQTMAALDKLLKSNELNFLLLSTVPATMVIYTTGHWVASKFMSWVNGGSRNSVATIRIIMRDIDRLLNIECSSSGRGPGLGSITAETQGRLVCLTYSLRRLARSVPNNSGLTSMRLGSRTTSVLPRSRGMFLQDITELESVALSSIQKRSVVERMYRTFQFL